MTAILERANDAPRVRRNRGNKMATGQATEG